MTDFLSTLTWVVLSSLIRQINSGIDNKLDQQNDTGIESGGGGRLGVGGDESEAYEPIVQIIRIGIAAFSILLLSLSLTAYKKTALKSIIYAAIAFGLFAVQTFFDYLQDAVKSFEQPYNDVIFYTMTLAILVLFFLGVVRRK
jgi:hypothetical protein